MAKLKKDQKPKLQNKAPGKTKPKKNTLRKGDEISFKSNSPEAKLMAARNPDEYVDACVKATTISSGRKAAVTRIWRDKTGFSSADIMFARNRHPYWKKQKMKNSYERNKARLVAHNYAESPRKRWNENDYEQFVEMMAENNNVQLAQKLKRSLASVNALKRRIKAGEKILAAENKKLTHKKLLEFISTDEKKLLEQVKKLPKKSR